ESGLIGEILVPDDGRLHAVLGRDRETAGIGDVREHTDDLGGVGGRFGGFNQRRHVGAAPRNQDRDSLALAHSASLPWKVTGSAPASVMRPMMEGRSPWSYRWATSASACSASTTQIMPTPQLKVR